jgi:hypothetical protein
MSSCVARPASARHCFQACRIYLLFTPVSFVISNLVVVSHIYRRAPSSNHYIPTCRRSYSARRLRVALAQTIYTSDATPCTVAAIGVRIAGKQGVCKIDNKLIDFPCSISSLHNPLMAPCHRQGIVETSGCIMEVVPSERSGTYPRLRIC